LLDRIYDDFTTKVAEGRKLPKEKVLEIAKGRVWTGEDAKALGLVDELGGFPVAVRLVREAAGLPVDAKIHLKEFPLKKSPLEALLAAVPTIAKKPARQRWRARSKSSSRWRASRVNSGSVPIPMPCGCQNSAWNRNGNQRSRGQYLMVKKLNQACVLTINGGSSSIKFALYQTGDLQKRRLYGKVDRIGLSGTGLTFHDPTGKAQDSRGIAASNHKSAAKFLIDWLEEQDDFASVRAVGHRVVHGMTHTEPERVTPELLDELHRLRPYDPDHLPREIELIEAFRQRHPKLPQVACFDTAFHRTMPRVAKILPIPRRFDTKGIQRYGFHGLSYAYLMEETRTTRRPGGNKAASFLRILATARVWLPCGTAKVSTPAWVSRRQRDW